MDDPKHKMASPDSKKDLELPPIHNPIRHSIHTAVVGAEILKEGQITEHPATPAQGKFKIDPLVRLFI